MPEVPESSLYGSEGGVSKNKADSQGSEGTLVPKGQGPAGDGETMDGSPMWDISVDNISAAVSMMKSLRRGPGDWNLIKSLLTDGEAQLARRPQNYKNWRQRNTMVSSFNHQVSLQAASAFLNEQPEADQKYGDFVKRYRNELKRPTTPYVLSKHDARTLRARSTKTDKRRQKEWLPLLSDICGPLPSELRQAEEQAPPE